MASINFRLTVIGRMVDRDKDRLVETINDVLALEDLAKQSTKKYETDMKVLAEMYEYDVNELNALIPEPY